jgi:hypothetical protein
MPRTTAMRAFYSSMTVTAVAYLYYRSERDFMLFNVIVKELARW